MDHNLVAIFSKVNPVTWSEVDDALVHPAANPFHVRPVSQAQSGSGGTDLCGSLRVKFIESLGEEAFPTLIQVLQNLDHALW